MTPPDDSNPPADATPAPSFPDDYIDVCGVDELAPGTGMDVEGAKIPTALFNDGGEFYAIRNECAHQFNPLHDGRVVNGEVICPLHGWRFALENGAYGIGNHLCLESFETRVDNGRVYVSRIPRPKPKRPT